MELDKGKRILQTSIERYSDYELLILYLFKEEDRSVVDVVVK